MRGEIEKVCAFLDKKPTEEQLVKITEHLRFNNFEKNESVNMEAIRSMGFMNPEGKFVRKGINQVQLAIIHSYNQINKITNEMDQKGKTGDWKNYFSPELNQRLDNWIADNLAGTDLKFVTELEQQD